MIPASTARIAGSVLCCWGWSRDPGNPACENVALPGFDLCPAHEKISKYLEAVAAQSPDNFDEADDYLHGQWEPSPRWNTGWTEDDALAAQGPA